MTSELMRIAAAFLYVSGSLISAAAQQQPEHARVAIVAKQNAIIPGDELRVGIHFLLEPGWHIYWVNPGDSGQPPVLKWQLPQGFNAGEIEWPRPERLQTSAELTDYGYHGEVLLPVTIRVPASVAAAKVSLAADAKWLVCREVCIPEHAQLSLELPVAQSAKDNPRSAPLFAKTERLLPRQMPRGWRAHAKSEKDHFILLLQTGDPIAKAEFFPLEADQTDNPTPQQVQPTPNGVRITLKKSDLLMKPIPVLRGVLVLAGGAYRIEAPVR